MKARIPGILIFCAVGTVLLGIIFIVLGALLNEVQNTSNFSPAVPIASYFIVTGALCLAAPAPCIISGILYARRRTLSIWLLIGAGLLTLPSLLGLFFSVPLFRSAYDIARALPPFHEVFTIPADRE